MSLNFTTLPLCKALSLSYRGLLVFVGNTVPFLHVDSLSDSSQRTGSSYPRAYYWSGAEQRWSMTFARCHLSISNSNRLILFGF